MNKISYIKDFANTALPHFKKAEKRVKSIAKIGKTNVDKAKSKIKCHLKLAKLKQIIELTMNIVLLIASVIALVIAFLQIICKRDK